MSRFAPLIVAAVLVCASLGAFFAVSSGHASDMAQMQNRINSLEMDIGAENDRINQENIKVVENASSILMDRVNDDTSKISQIMRTACTWENGAEYRAAREKLLTEYGLDANDSFFSTYMSELEELTDRYGYKSNTIDSHNYNMKYRDIDVRLASVQGGSYQYFAECTTESTFKDMSDTARCVLSFWTDTVGNVHDLSCVVVN